MGEANRRAAASPYARTTAGQLLRNLNAMYAALPPAPMNGATLLQVSPQDYEEIARRLEVSALTGRARAGMGLRIERDERLPPGVLVGREGDRVVWSNHPAIAEALELERDDHPTKRSA